MSKTPSKENKQKRCINVGENCMLYKTQLKEVNKASKKNSEYAMPKLAYTHGIEI